MSGGRASVLVIEDDQPLADALADLLSDEGYEVTVRHDGDQGYDAALTGAYDAIVLDIMLPKRSGFRVCQELRSAGVDTPLLMLTAKEGEWDEVEGLDAGADDFLRKPFERHVLIARLHALLRRQERGRLQPRTVGPITLDQVGRTVRVRGELVSLTPREYTLLELFVTHPNVALSKAEILDAVWGLDFDGEPNIVEVYAGYLRRKIDRPGEESFLRTIRGVGYGLFED